MRSLWALTLLLAACTAPVSGVYRDAAAPFAYTTRFEWPRFEGRWYEVGVIGRKAPGGGQRQLQSFQTAGGPLFRLLPAARIACARQDVLADCGGSGHLSGPARARGGKAVMTSAGPASADYYVLWTDESYRTAVLARHDGRFAVILDRAEKPAADRYRAAKTVLEFNGYNLAAWRDVSP